MRHRSETYLHTFEPYTTAQVVPWRTSSLTPGKTTILRSLQGARPRARAETCGLRQHTFSDIRWTKAELRAWQAAPSIPTETSIPASASRRSPLPAVRGSGSTIPATTLTSSHAGRHAQEICPVLLNRVAKIRGEICRYTCCWTANYSTVAWCFVPCDTRIVRTYVRGNEYS